MEPEEVQPPQEAEAELLTQESEAGTEAAAPVEAPVEASVEPAAEADVEVASGDSPAGIEAAEEAPPVDEETAASGDSPAAEETAAPGGDPQPEEEPAPEEEPIVAVYTDIELKAILEAVIYITDEPLDGKQMAQALGEPPARIDTLLAELVAEYNRPERGLQIREIAGGFKMATKPEHHEAVRQFVKNLKPSFKLTGAALETLAVIAYKQPITAPEIMEIRGVQGAGVLKTLLDRKLITTAGRKNVLGKPILYRTTKDFLVQFGLKSVGELPTLKEFEELRRLAFHEDDMAEEPAAPAPEAQEAATPEPQPEPAAEA